MKVETLKDGQGEVFDTSITLPQEELEKRHQTRVAEVTITMPDGRFARAFLHAASGPRGVQFELTCLTHRSKETSVRAVANFREPRKIKI